MRLITANIQLLELPEIEKREVTTADERSHVVPCVGPVQIRFQNRTCFTGAMVTGEAVLPGAAPMEDTDQVISPSRQTITVNPRSPNEGCMRIARSLPALAGMFALFLAAAGAIPAQQPDSSGDRGIGSPLNGKEHWGNILLESPWLPAGRRYDAQARTVRIRLERRWDHTAERMRPLRAEVRAELYDSKGRLIGPVPVHWSEEGKNYDMAAVRLTDIEATLKQRGLAKDAVRTVFFEYGPPDRHESHWYRDYMPIIADVGPEPLPTSPDGKIKLEIGDGVAQLVDVATDRPIGKPLRRQWPITCWAFSPDGKLVATGGGIARNEPGEFPLNQGEVCVWSTATGELVTTSGNASVWNLYGADGKLIARSIAREMPRPGKVKSVTFGFSHDARSVYRTVFYHAERYQHHRTGP